MRDESHLIVHDFSNKQFSSLKRIIKVIKVKIKIYLPILTTSDTQVIFVYYAKTL